MNQEKSELRNLSQEVLTAMLLMTLVSAVLEVYLAFAVFSEKPKLPVF